MKHKTNKKKTLASYCVGLLLFAVVLLYFTPTVHAASASLSASSQSVTAGSTVTFTVNISGADSATSAAVVVSYGSKLELVSGEWLKSGLADFNTSTKQGALAFTSAGSMNGGLFRVTMRATSYDASAQTVNINVIIRNGASTVYSQTVSSSVKITCASHNYGGWSSVLSASCTAGGREQRSCSVCGGAETRDTNALGHSWGAFSETKAPTCTATGTQTRTCNRCNASETKSIKATGHSYDKLKETKAPTCTKTGEKVGTCKTCGEKVTESIKATGHSFSEWKETVAPTFEKPGIATRICKTCNVEETRSIESLGYAFSDPTVAKDSVFVYYDVTTQINADSLLANGHANVRFAVPEGAGNEVKLYYVDESGKFEEITATLSDDGSVIETQITKTGTYAVCKILNGEADITVNEMATDNKSENDESNKSNHPWGWIAMAELIVIIGLIVCYLIRSKNEKIA